MEGAKDRRRMKGEEEEEEEEKKRKRKKMRGNGKSILHGQYKGYVQGTKKKEGYLKN